MGGKLHLAPSLYCPWADTRYTYSAPSFILTSIWSLVPGMWQSDVRFVSLTV